MFFLSFDSIIKKMEILLIGHNLRFTQNSIFKLCSLEQ